MEGITTCGTCGGRRDLKPLPGAGVAYGEARRLFFEHHAQGDCTRCAIEKAEAEQERERHRREAREREQQQAREREEEARASVCGECNGPRDPQMRFWVGDRGLCESCNAKRKAQERRAKLWGRLQERIGWELQNLDPEHPDFDRAAYEKAQQWDSFRYLDADGRRVDPAKEELSGRESLLASSLYLYGPAGCGKTRIAVALCERECANFHFVEFITEPQFVAAVSAMATPATREASAELFADLSEAELLFFDDLGTASLTEARYSRLFDLVDSRYREGSPTVWTSNKTPGQLAAWVKRFWIKQGGDEEEAQTNADKLLRRIFGTVKAPLADVIECHRQS